MSKSRITAFARQSRSVKRDEQPFAGYYRQAVVPLNEKLTRVGRGTPGGEYLRRLITENIDALQNGEDFRTIEQADKIDGIVATYTRDSVMTIV
jgi:hypothetical protein